MKRTLEGVAVLLHVPVRGTRTEFGQPRPGPNFLYTPVRYKNADVGQVDEVWVDGDKVRWTGSLDEPDLVWVDNPDPRITIPLPEPGVRDLIEAGRLVAAPSHVQGASINGHGSRTVLDDWQLAGLELMEAQAAPWPGLELRVR